MQHFAKITNKASKMQQRVHDISFEITGSELAALLLENNEIKKHQPDINRAMRRNSYPYALYAYEGANGYMHLAVHKKNRIPFEEFELLKEFPKIHGAKNKLKQLIEKFGLCLNKTELETGPGPCFNYQIKQCQGACIGEESPEDYNERVTEAIEKVRLSLAGSALLIDNGRKNGEKVLIAIQDGHYYGFGFIEEGASLNSLHEAFDYVRKYPETPESMKIIESFVNSNKLERIIHF
jgi:DNA polymerase-3 subunit epsilon